MKMKRYACPNCGDRRHLSISAIVEVDLLQPESEDREVYTESSTIAGIERDHLWDGDSLMTCICGCCDASRSFEVTV